MTLLDIGLSATLFLVCLVTLVDWRAPRPIDWDAEDPLTEARQYRSE